jgi:hypothetical protein
MDPQRNESGTGMGGGVPVNRVEVTSAAGGTSMGSLTARQQVIEFADRISGAMRTQLEKRTSSGLEPLPADTQAWLRKERTEATPWARAWVIHSMVRTFGWNWEGLTNAAVVSSEDPLPAGELPPEPAKLGAGATPQQQVDAAVGHVKRAMAQLANARVGGGGKLMYFPSGAGTTNGPAEWLGDAQLDADGWVVSVVSGGLHHMNWD